MRRMKIRATPNFGGGGGNPRNKQTRNPSAPIVHETPKPKESACGSGGDQPQQTTLNPVTPGPSLKATLKEDETKIKMPQCETEQIKKQETCQSTFVSSQDNISCPLSKDTHPKEAAINSPLQQLPSSTNLTERSSNSSKGSPSQNDSDIVVLDHVICQSSSESSVSSRTEVSVDSSSVISRPAPLQSVPLVENIEAVTTTYGKREAENKTDLMPLAGAMRMSPLVRSNTPVSVSGYERKRVPSTLAYSGECQDMLSQRSSGIDVIDQDEVCNPAITVGCEAVLRQTTSSALHEKAVPIVRKESCEKSSSVASDDVVVVPKDKVNTMGPVDHISSSDEIVVVQDVFPNSTDMKSLTKKSDVERSETKVESIDSKGVLVEDKGIAGEDKTQVVLLENNDKSSVGNKNDLEVSVIASSRESNVNPRNLSNGKEAGSVSSVIKRRAKIRAKPSFLMQGNQSRRDANQKNASQSTSLKSSQAVSSAQNKSDARVCDIIDSKTAINVSQQETRLQQNTSKIDEKVEVPYSADEMSERSEVEKRISSHSESHTRENSVSYLHRSQAETRDYSIDIKAKPPDDKHNQYSEEKWNCEREVSGKRTYAEAQNSGDECVGKDVMHSRTLITDRPNKEDSSYKQPAVSKPISKSWTHSLNSTNLVGKGSEKHGPNDVNTEVSLQENISKNVIVKDDKEKKCRVDFEDSRLQQQFSPLTKDHIDKSIDGIADPPVKISSLPGVIHQKNSEKHQTNIVESCSEGESCAVTTSEGLSTVHSKSHTQVESASHMLEESHNLVKMPKSSVKKLHSVETKAKRKLVGKNPIQPSKEGSNAKDKQSDKEHDSNSDDSCGDKENSSKMLSGVKSVKKEPTSKEWNNFKQPVLSKPKSKFMPASPSRKLVSRLEKNCELTESNSDFLPEEKRKKIFRERKDKYKKKVSGGVLDHSKMTMFDLIYWNPATNPMPGRTDSQKKRNRLSSKCETESVTSDVIEEQNVDDLGLDTNNTTSAQDPPDPPQEEQEQEESPPPPDSPESKVTDDLENQEDAFAPRVKIGPNGQIILDEESIKIQTTAAKNRDEILSKTEVVEENSDTAHYGRWSKKRRRASEWTVKETARFYKALSTVGTDFSLMETLFTWRSRAELKIKFKKEERANRELVDRALQDRTQFDFSLFDDESDYDPVEDRKAAREAERAEAKRKRMEMKQIEKEKEKEEKYLKKKEEKAESKQRKTTLRKLFKKDLKKRVCKRKGKSTFRNSEYVTSDFSDEEEDIVPSDADPPPVSTTEKTSGDQQTPVLALKRRRKRKIVPRKPVTKKAKSPEPDNFVISEVTVVMETVRYAKASQPTPEYIAEKTVAEDVQECPSVSEEVPNADPSNHEDLLVGNLQERLSSSSEAARRSPSSSGEALNHSSSSEDAVRPPSSSEGVLKPPSSSEEALRSPSSSGEALRPPSSSEETLEASPSELAASEMRHQNAEETIAEKQTDYDHIEAPVARESRGGVEEKEKQHPLPQLPGESDSPTVTLCMDSDEMDVEALAPSVTEGNVSDVSQNSREDSHVTRPSIGNSHVTVKPLTSHTEKQNMWYFPVSAITTHHDGQRTIKVPAPTGEKHVPVPTLPQDAASILVVALPDPKSPGELIYHVYVLSPAANENS